VPELRAAHEKALQGQLGAAALHELQNRWHPRRHPAPGIRGAHSITDGEYRRSSFHADFIEKLAGARAAGRLDVEGTVSGFDENKAKEGKPFAPRAFMIVGKLRHGRPIEVENFSFVKANTQRTAKQTIPSPTMLLRGGRAAVNYEAYPDLEEFLRRHRRGLPGRAQAARRAGCRYVQLDDNELAFLCDPRLADTFRRDGYDLDEMPERFANLINSAIAERPAAMVSRSICAAAIQWASGRPGAATSPSPRSCSTRSTRMRTSSILRRASGGIRAVAFFSETLAQDNRARW